VRKCEGVIVRTKGNKERRGAQITTPTLKNKKGPLTTIMATINTAYYGSRVFVIERCSKVKKKEYTKGGHSYNKSSREQARQHGIRSNARRMATHVACAI
jgi:hypothetical protein